MDVGPSIAILCIATNNYIYHAKKLYQSIMVHGHINMQVHFCIFTDRVDQVIDLFQPLEKSRFHVFEIPAYGWPEATLLRYREIYAKEESLRDFEYLLYLDADSIVKRDIFGMLENILQNNDIALVQHPGFWRESNGRARIKYYLRHPGNFARDLKTWLLVGGIGSWETRRESQAYVSRERRNNYYCGGTWFGRSCAVLELCKELAVAVDDDLKNGIIAKWHDESHLNAWASKRHFKKLDPSWCYAEGYSNLKNLSPLIVAVEKSEDAKTR